MTAAGFWGAAVAIATSIAALQIGAFLLFQLPAVREWFEEGGQ